MAQVTNGVIFERTVSRKGIIITSPTTLPIV
jgi:hypothetical protein